MAKRADSIWIATGRHSTKVTNISKNREVSIGVPAEGDPNGDAVAVGTATLHDEAPTDVLEMFDAKYQWYPRPGPDPDVGELIFVEITPHRWMMGTTTPNE